MMKMLDVIAMSSVKFYLARCLHSRIGPLLLSLIGASDALAVVGRAADMTVSQLVHVYVWSFSTVGKLV